MFYLTAHRVVFEAINALYARGAAVDMLTVTEELRAQGRLDDAGGPFAVAKLAAGVATSAHLEYHCGILFSVLPEAEAGGGADTGAGGGKRYDV